MKNLVTINIPPLGVIISAGIIALLGLGLLYWARRRARAKGEAIEEASPVPPAVQPGQPGPEGVVAASVSDRTEVVSTGATAIETGAAGQSKRTSRRHVKPGISAEILRDIGVAFIVAAVVTVVYEANTRSVKEHSDMVTVLNTIMESGITRDVWGEVQTKVLSRNRLRRGAIVRVKLLREVTLPDGRKIVMPPHQLVMFMKYEYDLYSLTSGAAKVPIWHALDWQMYDKSTDLPMFTSIEVKSGNQVIWSLNAAQIKNTKGVFDRAKGTMSLEGDLDEKRPLHVTTERYEVVSFPGAYTLYMPDTVAPPLPGQDPTTREPTIKVDFEFIPDNIQVKLETYLEEHVFNPSDEKKRVWEFKGIMLLGQAVSFTFSKKSAST